MTRIVSALIVGADLLRKGIRFRAVGIRRDSAEIE